jgi:transposase
VTHRHLTYPSPWPKYVVAAAATLGVLAGLHMFLVGFATWALKMQGPALRHVLSVPYARVVPILARCAPAAAGLPASGTARADRERCLQWWRALGWFAETRGQDYFAFTAAVTALLAGVAYSESRKRLRVPASESPATSRWSPEDDLRDFSPRKNPEARAESGALPMGTTVPGYGTRRPVELWLLDLPRFRGDPETGGNSLRKELTMPRSRPPYPREFREEAVRLVRSSGRPIAQIARELGIAHGTLSAWVKQAELDAGLRSDGLTTAEREELRRLRRENRILREEREILKKAAAFFARETESKP